MKTFKLFILSIALGASLGVAAREVPGTVAKKSGMKALADGCAPATAQTDLSINNIRALIHNGGDMWWDLNQNPRYEAPKGSGRHSMFAGALWLGGVDEAEQLKLAAMTYRSRGVDFWPGPLTDDNTASVTRETCARYDRQWVVLREEVELHAAWIECKADPNCNVGTDFPGYEGNIPQSIRDWPGNGIDGEVPNKMAPYFEGPDGTPGFYEAEFDYPAYDLKRALDCKLKETDLLYGDQTIWWIYNDKGNTHTESQAGALGFEIRAQSFAFTSNDEINNMTFNNYRIINKSTFRLTDTYFGTWFDPDIGFANDDIIGCDIARGLGYCYNGDAEDEGPRGYGFNPPAVGFDFFQGPFADYFDGLDNDRDGCVDGVKNDAGICISEDPNAGVNERIIMSGFMYYNNAGIGAPNQNTTDPSTARQFYNYLQSRWTNGNNLVIETPSGAGDNGNGDGFTANGSGTRTFFAYPGLSYDTTGAVEPSAPIENGGWWEAPNNQKDKRGLHCAGPFSLAPGALNFITTGTVWARNFGSNDLFAAVDDVIIADDKAQQLFDNCFQILDGPKSPSVDIVELDRKIIIKLQNAFNDNTLNYEQIDPLIPPLPSWSGAQIDSARKAGYFSYKFEGFQIFQVSGPDVSVDNLYNDDQSRLVAQCDVKNNIDQLVNYEVRADLDGSPLEGRDMTLEANNDGISLTFEFVEDEFAEGDKEMINNREYYYYIVAYSQNNYKKFEPRSMTDDEDAQKRPYLAGRDLGNGQKPYLAIPHNPAPVAGGTILNSDYGDEIQLTRTDGNGNGGVAVEITQATEDEIVTNFYSRRIQYEEGAAPIQVTVVDPYLVNSGEYILSFENGDPSTFDLDTARWYVLDLSSGDTIAKSEFNISFLGEQLIEDLGVSVTIINALDPGNDTLGLRNNGVISGTITFDDPTKTWLFGVPDVDGEDPLNWILAGTQDLSDGVGQAYNDVSGDDKQFFEDILGGTWAPMRYASDVIYDQTDPSDADFVGSIGFGVRPERNSAYLPDNELPNVDIVFTSDHTKWTRVPVFELGDIAESVEGNVPKFELRSGTTLNKTADGALVPDQTGSTGWSYFPGYAINVETGKRLNMAFGENSWLVSENGRDMMWNPTQNITRQFDFALGGMHVLYVFNDSTFINGTIDLGYKGDNIDDHPLKDPLENMSSALRKRNIYKSVAWVSIPMIRDDFAFTDYRDIATDVKVSLRVTKRFRRSGVAGYGPNQGAPQYEFSTNGYQSIQNDRTAGSEALDLIRVVPNPYYGGSYYEDSQLDNIVKITNLPPQATVSIFMTNGTLIRTINKDNSLTFVEWDLKNDFNVPISSGIYLIHIDAGELGEKVVKWMGSLRPVDLNAF